MFLYVHQTALMQIQTLVLKFSNNLKEQNFYLLKSTQQLIELLYPVWVLNSVKEIIWFKMEDVKIV